jgi:pumilio RNA-binding family
LQNYVIQFVLEKGLPQDRRRIVETFREGQMLHMARHKFASNVCEKALSMADEEEREILVNEMLSSAQDGQPSVAIMMKDQYASKRSWYGSPSVLLITLADYVLQKALKVLEGRQLEALINAVRPHLTQMRRHAPALAKHTNAGAYSSITRKHSLSP